MHVVPASACFPKYVMLANNAVNFILFILASRYPANIKLANICLKQNFAKYNFHQYFQ